MGDPTYPYSDIREVRNVGRRRANILLDHDWVLIDWKSEQIIERRTLPERPDQPVETMYFKIETIHYILGRPSRVGFSSEDLAEFEKRRRREEQEAQQPESKQPA